MFQARSEIIKFWCFLMELSIGNPGRPESKIWRKTIWKIRKIQGFQWKVPLLLSLSPSTGDANTWSTSQVDFSTLNMYMDKPSWCLINRETIQKNLPLKFVCNNPRPFLFQFPEKSWFWWSRQVGDDPGMNILNLMCSNGPGWLVGAYGCLKHGLYPSRSILRSRTI